MSMVQFVVRDHITNQKFGGAINFRGVNPNYPTLPYRVYFSYLEELEDTIELLTKIRELAREQRRIYYGVEDPHIIKGE
jgi:hypothetical protein